MPPTSRSRSANISMPKAPCWSNGNNSTPDRPNRSDAIAAWRAGDSIPLIASATSTNSVLESFIFPSFAVIEMPNRANASELSLIPWSASPMVRLNFCIDLFNASVPTPDWDAANCNISSSSTARPVCKLTFCRRSPSCKTFLVNAPIPATPTNPATAPPSLPMPPARALVLDVVFSSLRLYLSRAFPAVRNACRVLSSPRISTTATFLAMPWFLPHCLSFAPLFNLSLSV